MEQGRFPIFTKTTEPMRVAYTRFLGLMNATSRIWMVRDWARREGFHLIGAPRCTLSFDGGTAETASGEVQWSVAEAVEPFDGEIGVRLLPPTRVIATFHQGDTATLNETAAALQTWGASQGYRLGRSPCEIYWFDVRSPQAHWITEIQWAIENGT
jgi:effector-binding domain-containing protein